MGRFVIVAYTPKPAKDEALLAAVKEHLHVLRDERLISDKPGYAMRAADGTLVEGFEWLSADAIERAESNRAVQAHWDEFGADCSYTRLAKLNEHSDLFAEFDAIEP